MAKLKTYSELRRLNTFEERFRYLSLGGYVGESTFGFDRWMNQIFYRSREWKLARHRVILRDGGCDLGIPGQDIFVDLVVHHMNPIALKDIQESTEWLLEPEYLITTSLQTHNAIHYGNDLLLPRGPIVREPGDTKLW